VPTLAAIVVVALCVTAGLWQRDRMQQKLALRAALEAAVAQAPVPLPATTDWSAWRFRPVTVSGAFDEAHQILLDNRVRGGRVGYDVVTPFLLADGRIVLVDRGWIAAGVDRGQLPQVPPPAGNVTVSGRLNLPPGAYLELARDTTAGPRWQNLDMKRMEAMLGRPVLPIVVEQTAPLRAGDDLLRTRPAPDFGVDTHRMYMVQWFIFATMAAGLWVWFTVRRKR
jgi:surfeit locus 1 family protein